jgi:hypothetical protein
MGTIWLVTLFMGFGLHYSARNSCHYGLRLISRTFGPLLIVAGLVGFVATPSSWGLALVILGCTAAGVAMTVAVLLIAKLRRRMTH